jgi:hypothetical protein
METGETVLFVQFSYSRTAFRIMKSTVVVRREKHPAHHAGACPAFLDVMR